MGCHEAVHGRPQLQQDAGPEVVSKGVLKQRTVYRCHAEGAPAAAAGAVGADGTLGWGVEGARADCSAAAAADVALEGNVACAVAALGGGVAGKDG